MAKLTTRAMAVTNDTIKVALWVFASAGLTAFLSWVLNRPEFINYYGVVNVLLYLLNEIKKQVKK